MNSTRRGYAGHSPLEDVLSRLVSGDALLSVDRHLLFEEYQRMRQENIELREQVTQEQQHKLTDELTQTWNRRYLEQHLARLGQQSMRPQYRGDSWIVVIDGDGVKQVNDTAGHLEGDRAIRLIATYLQELMRPNDPVFRFGGDEFILTYIQVPEINGRLSRLVEGFLPYVAREETAAMRALTLSIGATSILPGENPQSALKRADDAMYVAKKKRNTWHIA